MRRLLVTFSAILAVAGGLLAAQATRPPAALALGNGLDRTPAMAFNTWTHFGCNISQTLLEQVADKLVSTGLRDDGYRYVVIDDCWMSKSRDSAGNLVADPTKFPGGIKALADYLHARGLKLGIYEDAGTKTCQGLPGSYGHEQQDADLFASWGVDYLKYDWCNIPYGDFPGDTHDQVAQALYTRMHDALAATGRPILFDMCNGWDAQVHPWEWASAVANQWRIGNDPKDSWRWVDYSFRRDAALNAYAAPGGWNNPGHILAGLGNLTHTEYVSQFSLWAEMAAPLQFSTDITTADSQTLATLGNQDVIAIDQDPLGKQGYVVAHHNGQWVLTKPLANGDRAVVLFNETSSTTSISTTARAVGMPTAAAYTLRDLWTSQTTETAGTIHASVPAHGVRMYRVATNPRWAQNPPATSVSIDAGLAYDGAPAATAQPGKTMAVHTTFTNTGHVAVTHVQTSLSVPNGWRVMPESATSTGELGTGASFTTSWQVTPPEGPVTSPAGGTDDEACYWWGSYWLDSYWQTNYWNECKPPTFQYSAATTFQWGGATRGSAETTTPVDLLDSTPPPTGTSHLSDRAWAWASNYWGPVETNTSNGTQAPGDGKPISIRGTSYATGFGTSAPSEIVFYLGGHCSTVTSDVGIDNEKTGGSAYFEIWADGVKKADSGLVTGNDAAKTLTANVSGATWLRLITEPASTGPNDHTDWADPTITC